MQITVEGLFYVAMLYVYIFYMWHPLLLPLAV